ncbi:MAG: glycosyltransferase involved in cell wall biosynthesis, partial [Saprospiraceae bacterium]
SPESIADGIKKLILNPNLRNTLGENARAKVLSKYNGERIGRMMEETYSLAIENWVKVSDV